MCRLPVDAVTRLFVLAKEPATLKDRLRLSNADAARLEVMASLPEVSPILLEPERRRMLYHLGAAAWRDGVHLSWAKSRAKMDDAGWLTLLALPEQWRAPAFPLTGADVLAAGLAPGPKVGQVLSALEDWWVASDFVPTRDDLLARMGRYGR
jgi:poly(A) polymerase